MNESVLEYSHDVSGFGKGLRGGKEGLGVARPYQPMDDIGDGTTGKYLPATVAKVSRWADRDRDGDREDGKRVSTNVDKKGKTNFLKVKIPESLLKANTTQGSPTETHPVNPPQTQNGHDGHPPVPLKREKKSTEHTGGMRLDSHGQSDFEVPSETKIERPLSRFKNQRLEAGNVGAIRSRLNEIKNNRVTPATHSGCGSQAEYVTRIEALLAKSRKAFGPSSGSNSGQPPKDTPLQVIRSRLAQSKRESSASNGPAPSSQEPKSGSMVYKSSGLPWISKNTVNKVYSARKNTQNGRLPSSDPPKCLAKSERGVYVVKRSVSKKSQGEEGIRSLAANSLVSPVTPLRTIESILGDKKTKNIIKIRSLEAFASSKLGKADGFKRPGLTGLRLPSKGLSGDKYFKRAQDNGYQTDRIETVEETVPYHPRESVDVK